LRVFIDAANVTWSGWLAS